MPIGKVEVSLHSAEEKIFLTSRFRERNPFSIRTDADGHFRIEVVPAGDYRVSLQKNGFLSAARKSQRDSPALVSLAQGEQLEGLLFRVLLAGVIRGKIVDEDGDPLQNVNVMAIPAAKGFGPSASAMTNDLGEYRLAGLPAGKNLVLANGAEVLPVGDSGHDTGEVYAPTFFPGTLERAQAASVEVHRGEEAEAVFGLVATRTFSVRGRVASLAASNAGTDAPNGESVMLLREALPWSGSLSAQVLPDGTFEIRGVPPGTYSAVIATPNGSWHPARGSEIDVRGSDVDGLRLAPEPTGEVRGRFRMDDGPPFNWTQLSVYLGPDDSESRQQALIGKAAKDGSFKIEDVPAGNYHVVVMADSNSIPDYSTKQVIVNGKDAGDSGFAAGPGVSILDIVTSAKGAVIAGTVVDGDNKTAFDVPVVCVPDETHRKRRDAYQQAALTGAVNSVFAD